MRPFIRLSRLTLAVALLAGIVGGLAAPAAAHAQLLSTSPAAGSVVPKSPGRIVLHFGEAVELEFGSVEVFDSHAHRVDSGTDSHPPGDRRSVQAGVPAALPAGGYVVTWRVISADSHPVHGAFTFSIGATAGTDLRSEAAGLLAKGGGNEAVGVVFGVARFLEFATLAILLGGVFFLLALWPAGRGDRRARRLVWLALAAAVISTAAAFALQGPYGGALGLASTFKPSVLSGVWHTKYGHLTALRAGLLLVSGPLLATLLRRRASIPLAGVAAIDATILLATFGLAGHAATGALIPVAMPFDVIHLGAASIWLGGLVMVVLAVIPASRGDAAGPGSPLRRSLPGFSQWALGSVIAIAVTGGFAAWRQVRILGALTGTTFGRLVLAKVGAFGAVVAIATVSRIAVHGTLDLPILNRLGRDRTARPAAAVLSHGPGAMAMDPDAGIAARLRKAAAGEIAVILIVLALTAVLVNAQPGYQAYAAPFSTEVHAGPDLVDVTLSPAKAGPVALHTYVLTAAGSQLDVPEVDVTMSQHGGAIQGLAVPVARAGPGHWVAYNFVLPLRGTWTVQVKIRTNDIDEYNAEPFTVHVR